MEGLESRDLGSHSTRDRRGRLRGGEHPWHGQRKALSLRSVQRTSGSTKKKIERGEHKSWSRYGV